MQPNHVKMMISPEANYVYYDYNMNIILQCTAQWVEICQVTQLKSSTLLYKLENLNDMLMILNKSDEQNLKKYLVPMQEKSPDFFKK